MKDWSSAATSALIVLCGILGAVLLYGFFRGRERSLLGRCLGVRGITTVDEDHRRAVLATLSNEYAAFSAGSNLTVDVLLVEAKAAHELSRDRIKQLETKAVSIIGIVTTGLGALAILGDPHRIPSYGLWLEAAIVALGLSFVSAVLAITPLMLSRYPDLSYYAIPETVGDAANAARVKFHFAQGIISAIHANYHVAIVKGKLVVIAAALLGAALFALIANFWLARQLSPPSNTVSPAAPPVAQRVAANWSRSSA